MKRITIFFVTLAVASYFGSHSFAQDRPRLVNQSGVNSTGKLALELKATLTGHEDQVWAVALTPNGDLLATGSYGEKATRLWTTATGQLIATLHGTAPVFSPDGQVLLTTSKKTARLWDAATGRHKFTLTAHDRDITSACFSRDGSKLATGSEDGTVVLWEVATGRPLATLTVWRVKKIARYRIFSRLMHIPVTVHVKFSPDDQTVLTTTYWEESRAKLWDATSGRLQAQLAGHTTVAVYENKEVGVTDASFSPDGKFIVTESYSALRLWETETRTLIGEYNGFSTTRFSPDSKWLGPIRIGKDVGLLNPETLKFQATPDVDTNFLNQQAFSPDSRTYVIGSGFDGYNATLIDVSTGEVRTRIRLVGDWRFDLISNYLKNFDLLSFHPSSKLLMGANHNSIRMWDVSTGKLLWETTEGRDPAVFSRDGKLFVSVGKDKKTVLVWKLNN